MAMNPSVLPVLAAAFFVAVGLLETHEIIFPPEAWRQASRPIGAPLTGYWRLAIYDGCYEGASIHQFAEDHVRIYDYPEVSSFRNPQYVVRADGRVEVHFPDSVKSPGAEAKMVFRDLGDRLEWEMDVNNGVQTSMKELNMPDLVNCGVYSARDRLALIKERAFRPVGYREK